MTLAIVSSVVWALAFGGLWWYGNRTVERSILQYLMTKKSLTDQEKKEISGLVRDVVSCLFFVFMLLQSLISFVPILR